MKVFCNKKFIPLFMTGFIMSLTSCYDEPIIDNTTSYFEEISKPIEIEDNSIKEHSIFIEPVRISDDATFVDIDSLEYNTKPLSIVVADCDTIIYDVDGNRLGKFVSGRNYNYLDENDTSFIIDYFGINGYVSKEDTFLSSKDRVTRPIINKGCMKEVTSLYEDKDLTIIKSTLDIREFVEIHGEVDDSYLVQTRDEVGYVSKDKVTLMEKDAAIVDIMYQEMRGYQGNELKAYSPVVTGTINTSRRSDEGLFTIRTKYYPSKPFDISPGYKVKGVLYYNGGEGIHTANTWRSEYGGDIAWTNGSHGCINTPDDYFEEFYEFLEIGENVLVFKKTR